MSRSLNSKAFPCISHFKTKIFKLFLVLGLQGGKKPQPKSVSILTLFMKHFEGQEREGIIFGHSSSSGGIVIILTRRPLYIRALLIHITDNLSEASPVRHRMPVIVTPAGPCLHPSVTILFLWWMDHPPSERNDEQSSCPG